MITKEEIKEQMKDPEWVPSWRGDRTMRCV